MSAAVQTLEAGLVLAVERIAKLEAPASNVVDLVADFFGRPPAHLNPKLITDEISSKIIRQMLKDKNYELLHRPGVLTSVHKAAILFTDKGADEITFKSKGEEITTADYYARKYPNSKLKYVRRARSLGPSDSENRPASVGPSGTPPSRCCGCTWASRRTSARATS